MRQLENDGKTAVVVTVEGEAVGVIAVADVDKEVGVHFFSLGKVVFACMTSNQRWLLGHN